MRFERLVALRYLKPNAGKNLFPDFFISIAGVQWGYGPARGYRGDDRV